MNTILNNTAVKMKSTKLRKGGRVKRLFSTAAMCLALNGAVVATAEAAAAATRSAPAETTLQEAFATLIADSKSQMMRDPANALDHATNAENLVRSATAFDDRDTAIATAMWLRGEALMRVGKPEVAASVVAGALDLVGRDGLETKLGGDLLLAQGRAASRASDVATAVRSFHRAHKVFVKLGETRSEAIALMAIGSIHRDAQSFEKALDYYERASEVHPGDMNMDLSSFNNRANTLTDLARYDEAKAFYLEALEIAEEMNSDVLRARILTNIAELDVLDGRYAEAEQAAADAMALLDGDDATEWARFVYGAQAHAKLKQGDIAAASALIEKAFDGLEVADTSMTFEEMHDVAYQIFLMRGDYGKALKHHESFKRLSDNAKKIASTANLALLNAKFHTAEQELNIERLRNEQLHKDMLLEDANRQMTIQIAILALGSLVLLFSILSIATLRRHRSRMAKVNTELQSTVDQLNAEIARREIVERDLVAAKEQAEEAARMKSTFLATMSHELRTPMNGILGFSKILLSGDLTDDQREQVAIIEQSGEALLGLINDILDLSQMEAGKLQLHEGAFNLRSTIEDTVKLLQPKAREKGLNLAVQIDPAIPALVMGDKDRMRQILVNLVGNAVKFTETGSVAVVASKGEGENAISLSVRDTGIGIADDKVAILFNRFQQADGSTTRKYGGTGLGLAICKELVEAMGGEIGVDTVLGEGSTFRLSVALAPAEDLAILPRRTETTLAEPKRIVVVDPIAVNRDVFALMLPAMNAEPHLVASGAEAIERLAGLNADGAPVDAVIVNAQLDDMAPGDLAARLKRNGLVSDAAMILAASSAVGADDLAAMGYDAQIGELITDSAVFAKLEGLAPVETGVDQASAEVIAFTARRQVSGRVLVVEDSPSNQEFIAAVLGEYDVKTDAARNGAEAVEAARETAYDLILMDVAMPNMNGVEATRRIRRADGVNARTPIIALTAKSSEAECEEYKAAGMDDVLAKPLELAPLRSKVKSVLERRTPRKDGENGEVVALDA